MEAARAIDLSAYANWTDAERIVLAVDATYRELRDDAELRSRVALFGEMGELNENP